MDGGGFCLHSVVLEGTALRVKLHGGSRLTVYVLQHVGTRFAGWRQNNCVYARHTSISQSCSVRGIYIASRKKRADLNPSLTPCMPMSTPHRSIAPISENHGA